MDQQAYAEAILRRFSSPIHLAVEWVLKEFGLDEDYHARDELYQEARIQVARYAGLIGGWQSGKLQSNWAQITEGDEEQIRLLMTWQLKQALCQIIVREQRKQALSLDALIESGSEPTDYDQEDRMITRISKADYRELYPTLSRNVLDGMTQAEIAEEEGVVWRTIARRIAKEKRAFLQAYVQGRGLILEGDETDDELAEAYGYLTVRPPPDSPPGLPLAA